MANDSQEVKAIMSQRLVEAGEKERLKEILKKRLCESGWRDEVKVLCKNAIMELGVKDASVDKIVATVTPKSRDLVPEVVKRELVVGIRHFLEDHPHENCRPSHYS